MGVTEVVSTAVEPVNKLIEAVTGAIGKAYEPRYVRKMAAAKAYEIKMIGDELRNNADLPIIYDASGSVSVDTTDYEALAKRAGKRIAYQEIAKQENIEAIVDSAYDSLQGVHELKEGKISREWMHRFIDAAGDISTEDLQKIWSKVLAGEVLAPKTFSLRTLECLRNLDAYDAKLFEKVCAFAVENSFIYHDNDFIEEISLPYKDILKLDECGLINSSGFISKSKKISKQPVIALDFKDYILVAKSEEDSELIIQAYPFTAAGCELSTLVDIKMELDLIKKICYKVARQNENIILSLHKVNYRKEEQVNYVDESIDFEN